MSFFPLLTWLLEVYRDLSSESPLLSSSLTTALMGGAGDFLAQTVRRQSVSKDTENKQDLNRVASVLLEGFFVSGPLMHVSYLLMDKYLHVDESGPDSIYLWSTVGLQALLEIVSFIACHSFISSTQCSHRTNDLANTILPLV